MSCRHSVRKSNLMFLVPQETFLTKFPHRSKVSQGKCLPKSMLSSVRILIYKFSYESNLLHFLDNLCIISREILKANRSPQDIAEYMLESKVNRLAVSSSTLKIASEQTERNLKDLESSVPRLPVDVELRRPELI